MAFGWEAMATPGPPSIPTPMYMELALAANVGLFLVAF